MKKLFLACFALSLAACAPSPSAIAPSSMGNAYAGISCAQARQALTEEQTKLAALSTQQNGAVAGDAIGVLLIGVPMSSLTGGDHTGDIATSKGKIEAYTARLATCS